MADYIYLLQNRLSAAQQAALSSIRGVARAHNLTVFLVGGAVRDLTSGSPVRDLDVVVQGNASKLKKDIELAGGVLTGELPGMQVVFARFPDGVRVEIGSTLSLSYPKPGKPVIAAATILDDLRRRDFTVNAMALSLNDGSYGLLMDPLNGVADIENRQLRLVSNYGFIEEPVRMIRAARFQARLGWTMDEKTQARYETGKDEKYISALSSVHRGYETEEIFHEEDPLRVMRRLEEEGWMKHLFPALTVAKANVTELEKLREVQTQLQVAGIHPDAAAANFPLLTAKMSENELAELKKSFARPGFVREIEGLEAEAKEFATLLSGKGAALPSQAWKTIHAAKPEAVLWVAYSSKNAGIQTKLKSFHTEWPKAQQKVPYVLMQEMRIVPELENFKAIVEKVFFELMDGNLTTPEEQKAFLEPFSPPAPPPPINMKRSRAGKKDSKAAKGKKKAAAIIDDDRDDGDDLDDEERNEIDAEVDQDEAGSEPDDENEAAEPIAKIQDEDQDEDEVKEAAPEIVLEPVNVVEPEPVVAASQPKRAVQKPAKVVVPAIDTPAVTKIEPVAAKQQAVPTAAKALAKNGFTSVPAKKAVAPVAKMAAKTVPAKAAAKQVKPTTKSAAKPMIAAVPKKPTNVTAKSAPKTPAKAAKAVAPATKAIAARPKVVVPAIKQAKGKQAAAGVKAPAKKVVPVAAKAPARKVAPVAVKAAGKSAGKKKR